jgi:uncharacterized protein YkwD
VVSWLPVLLLVSTLSPTFGPEPDLDALRHDLLLRLNLERERAGASPLRLVPALNQAAQQHAEETGRRRSPGPEPGGTEAMERRLRQVGYVAHTWDESFVVSWGDPRQVIAEWRSVDRGSDGMSPRFRDVGIGISEYRGTLLYTFLFGWHQGDYFARETAALRDLERVRAEMLSRVNAARRSAGLAPLRRSLDLDLAAQAHARDLLERGYYKHVSPEGTTPVSRARAAGYPSDLVSENLHQRTASIETVLEDWLRSPGHRRNILDPGASELGVGLALGPGYGLDSSGYRVVWVQTFGRRSETARLAP